MRKIKVLFIMPSIEPQLIKIPGTAKFIKSLIDKNLDFIHLQEEAYIIGSKNANIDNFNRCLGDSILLGNFIILNKRNGKVISLNKKQIRRYTNMFKLRRHQKRIDYYTDKFAGYTLRVMKNYCFKKYGIQSKLSA